MNWIYKACALWRDLKAEDLSASSKGSHGIVLKKGFAQANTPVISLWQTNYLNSVHKTKLLSFTLPPKQLILWNPIQLCTLDAFTPRHSLFIYGRPSGFQHLTEDFLTLFCKHIQSLIPFYLWWAVVQFCWFVCCPTVTHLLADCWSAVYWQMADRILGELFFIFP